MAEIASDTLTIAVRWILRPGRALTQIVAAHAQSRKRRTQRPRRRLAKNFVERSISALAKRMERPVGMRLAVRQVD